MTNPGTTQNDTKAPEPKIIPDVEIGLGAGQRNNNLVDVDPSKNEKLPGKDETPGAPAKEERLPGKEEKLLQ